MRSVEFVGIFSIGVANFRLAPAFVVGCANFQRVPPRAGDSPFIAPRSPDHGSRRGREIRRLPGSAAHSNFDAGDLPLSRPGNTLHAVSPDPNLLAFQGAQELR